ncbi:AlpA family phage regulatory protein [Acinetobacter sp. CUI P1]|nr:AlpA family phage regulatory protein [Acinetobacter sp. CUI P1]
MSNKNQHNTAPSMRLIRRKEVQLRTGLGASSIYALMQKDLFPKPVALSTRRVAWIESDIDLWIAERIQQKNLQLSTLKKGTEK